ncbi:MAG: hypothetical protein AAFZ58_04920 [Pseudomonadota bacterium]
MGHHSALLERFSADGFIAIDDVVHRADCDRLAGVLPDIVSSGSRTLLSNPAIAATADRLREAPGLGALLAELIPVGCTYFRKTLQHNWAVRAHRDRAVPLTGDGNWPSAGTKEGISFVQAPANFARRCIAVRLQLDSVAEADIEVIPGSHRTDSIAARRGAVALRATQGGVVVMSPNIVHLSSRLVSAESRRVLHFLFGPVTPPFAYRWSFAS